MIVRLVVLTLSVCILSLLIKQDFKAGALLLSAAGCLMIFSMSAGIIAQIGDSFARIKSIGKINGECFSLIIKMLAVAYVTSFGADICSDAGEKALSAALETAGKLIMLAMALPMLIGIFQSIADMLG